MAQQSALEIFWDQIAEILPFSVDSVTAIKLYEKYQEAKQKEREQMEIAYNHLRSRTISKIQTFDQYYTQTYGSNNKTK